MRSYPAACERKGEEDGGKECAGKNETPCGKAGVRVKPAVADDGSECGGGAGGRRPEDQAADGFGVEEAQSPFLD